MRGEGGLVHHDHLPLLALQLQDGPAAGRCDGGGGGGGDHRDERGDQAEGPDGSHGPTVRHHGSTYFSRIFPFTSCPRVAARGERVRQTKFFSSPN